MNGDTRCKGHGVTASGACRTKGLDTRSRACPMPTATEQRNGRDGDGPRSGAWKHIGAERLVARARQRLRTIAWVRSSPNGVCVLRGFPELVTISAGPTNAGGARTSVGGRRGTGRGGARPWGATLAFHGPGAKSGQDGPRILTVGRLGRETDGWPAGDLPDKRAARRDGRCTIGQQTAPEGSSEGQTQRTIRYGYRSEDERRRRHSGGVEMRESCQERASGSSTSK